MGTFSPHAGHSDSGTTRSLHAVTDAQGEQWFVKAHAGLQAWKREVRAYRHWTPSLGDRAPCLRGASRPHRAIVVSAVPGRALQGVRDLPAELHAEGKDAADVHAQAGRILRDLHGAQPPRPAPHLMATMTDQLESWLRRGDGLLTRKETDFVRGRVRGLTGEVEPRVFPCHFDYRPNNWVLDPSGTVRIIDFADSRWHMWQVDLTRLYFGSWSAHPHLADAFLEGYGHRLSRRDQDIICRFGAYRAAITIIWARHHKDAKAEERGRTILTNLMRSRRWVSRLSRLPNRVTAWG